MSDKKVVLVFWCGGCGDGFKTSDELKRHMKEVHHSGKVGSCRVCGRLTDNTFKGLWCCKSEKCADTLNWWINNTP